MRTLIYSLAIISLTFIDQITKWFVTETLLREQGQGFIDWMLNAPEKLGFTSVEVTPFFNWVMVWNRGVSFGLFNQESTIMPMILLAVAFIIVSIFIVWLYKADHKLQIIGALLIIAGALGNMIDRLRFQAVIDFIDLHVMGYHWPAFNAADAFVSGGAIVIIIYILFFEKTLQDEPQDTVS